MENWAAVAEPSMGQTVTVLPNLAMPCLLFYLCQLPELMYFAAVIKALPAGPPSHDPADR